MSYITRAITADGSARIIFANTTDIVEKTIQIHGLSKTATAALGRVLTAASLMGSLLKDKDNSLTLQFKADGPLGTVMAVSDYKGNVRGYAENPSVELKPNSNGKLDVGSAIGKNGTLYVMKDMGFTEPYIGMCPIVSGEVAEDVTQYFATSEQTPSVCALGVRVSQDRHCKAAGGFLIQLMPMADDEVIDKIEANLTLIDSVSSLIEQGKTAEKYERALLTLSQDDFSSLGEEKEPIEAVCRFCNQKYYFDFKELLSKRK